MYTYCLKVKCEILYKKRNTKKQKKIKNRGKGKNRVWTRCVKTNQTVNWFIYSRRFKSLFSFRATQSLKTRTGKKLLSILLRLLTPLRVQRCGKVRCPVSSNETICRHCGQHAWRSSRMITDWGWRCRNPAVKRTDRCFWCWWAQTNTQRELLVDECCLT